MQNLKHKMQHDFKSLEPNMKRWSFFLMEMAVFDSK